MAVTRATDTGEERLAPRGHAPEGSAEAVERAGQLDAIFESIADAVVVCDEEGRVLRANGAAHRLLALERQPDVAATRGIERGAHWRMRDPAGHPLPPDHDPLVRIVRGETLAGARAVDVVVRALDGRDADLNISGAPVRAADGRIVGGVVVMRDVTERRRLEHAVAAERDRLRQVLDALPEAVLIADATPAFVLGNRAARDLLGGDVVGQPLPVSAADGPPPSGARRLDGTPYPAPELPTQRAALRGETVRGAQFLVRDAAHGRDIPVLANSAPLRDAGGALAGAVIAFQDITALKDLEARLQTAVRLRDEFLSIAGHELRTPLTTVLGNIELAARWVDDLRHADGADGASPHLIARLARVAMALRRAERQGRVVTRLVTDLLDTSRIQAGRLALRPEPVDLASLVRETTHETQQLVPHRTVRLDVPAADVVPVVADGARVAHVLANYLSNALKFSANDRPVIVGLRVEGATARVWVRDAGPGLSPDERDRVWERFYRVAGAMHRDGSSVGLGLGLHISRSIVEGHGGQVGVESAPGEGATFWFSLPLAGEGTGGDPGASTARVE